MCPSLLYTFNLTARRPLIIPFLPFSFFYHQIIGVYSHPTRKLCIDSGPYPESVQGCRPLRRKTVSILLVLKTIHREIVSLVIDEEQLTDPSSPYQIVPSSIFSETTLIHFPCFWEKCTSEWGSNFSQNMLM